MVASLASAHCGPQPRRAEAALSAINPLGGGHAWQFATTAPLALSMN
jgi:hypothetical protein